MKIVHVTHHYIDGWGYQDNLFPLYQKKAGDEVVVISDINHLPQKDRESILEKGNEYYDNSIKIIRIKCYANTVNTSLICRGLYRHLIKEKPDLIFHHGVDSSTLIVSTWYKIRHPKTVLFVDSHADFVNMTKNKLWHLLYEQIWLTCICKLIAPWVNKYYGVSAFRCKYLHQVFRIPKKKIDLLPLGGDTDKVETIKETATELRNKYKIPTDNFVISSGGKMDATKGTLDLIDAFHSIKQTFPNTSLVLFGNMDEEVKNEVAKHDDIVVIGWCDRKQTLELLKLSDVAVWPLLHTSLIEDAVACATPIIVKESENVSHFAEEKNGIFLKRGDRTELEKALTDIREMNLSEEALSAQKKYSYRSIAEKVKTDYYKVKK